MTRLRDALQRQLEEAIPMLTANGSQQHRLPNKLHVSLPKGSSRGLSALPADEVALSPGAPCHSDGDDQPSGVMQATGATVQQSRGVVCIGLGYDTTGEEVQCAAQLTVEAYHQHRSDCGQISP